MARYDSADLLDKLRNEVLRRPASDEVFTTALGYSLLTQAQEHWYRVIAAVAPDELVPSVDIRTMTPVGALPTDAFLFGYQGINGTGTEVMGHVELYEKWGGNRLMEGQPGDLNTDFSREGNLIRFHRPRSTVPVWRGVLMPSDALDATHPPFLTPTTARILIPYRAAILFALGAGKMDPGPFRELERMAWVGDPAQGDYGILGTLRTKTVAYGGEAEDARWWAGIDTGAGYTRHG